MIRACVAVLFAVAACVPVSAAPSSAPSETLDLIFTSPADVSVDWAGFLPSGNILALVDGKDFVTWSQDAGEFMPSRESRGLKNPEGLAVLSPDAQYLVTVSDKSTSLWRRSRGELVRTIENPFAGTPVALWGDRMAVAAADGKSVLVMKASTGETVRTLIAERKGRPTSLAFSADGRTLAGALVTGTVTLWDVGTGERRPALAYRGWVYALAFSPVGDRFAAGFGRSVRVWDFDRPAPDTNTKADGPLLERFRKGAASDRMRLLGDGRESFMMSVRSLAFSPDGGRLAAGVGGNSSSLTTPLSGGIEIWDVKTSELVAREPVNGHVLNVAYSPDGSHLLSLQHIPSGKGGLARKELRVWRPSRMEVAPRPAPPAPPPEEPVKPAPPDLSGVWKLYQSGDLDSARRACESAIKRDPRAADFLDLMGYIERSSGNLESAERFARRALDARKADDPAMAFSLNSLAMVMHLQKRVADAESLYLDARRRWEKDASENTAELIGNFNNLGTLYAESSRFAAAESQFKQALAMAEEAYGFKDEQVALVLENFSDLYVRMDRLIEADLFMQKAAQIRAAGSPAGREP